MLKPWGRICSVSAIVPAVTHTNVASCQDSHLQNPCSNKMLRASGRQKHTDPHASLWCIAQKGCSWRLHNSAHENVGAHCACKDTRVPNCAAAASKSPLSLGPVMLMQNSCSSSLMLSATLRHAFAMRAPKGFATSKWLQAGTLEPKSGPVLHAGTCSCCCRLLSHHARDDSAALSLVLGRKSIVLHGHRHATDSGKRQAIRRCRAGRDRTTAAIATTTAATAAAVAAAVAAAQRCFLRNDAGKERIPGAAA